MSSNHEASLNIYPVSPERALEKGVEVGLLDIENTERINGIVTPKNGDDKSIILPALRVLEDFKLHEDVWIYDPMSIPGLMRKSVLDKDAQLDYLVLGEPGQDRGLKRFPGVCKLVKPYYYGLWHEIDLRIMMAYNSNNSGRRRLGPFFLIKNANTLAQEVRGITSTDEKTIYLINRGLEKLKPESLKDY